MSELSPICIWIISARLVAHLHTRFGDPTDCYVNGSQVWLRADGPDGIVIEWRLHPSAEFDPLTNTDHYELFNSFADAIEIGGETQYSNSPRLTNTWGGLEAFPAYHDEIEPALLAKFCTEAVGIEPKAYGLANHEQVAKAWEAAHGRVDVIELLTQQLGQQPS